MKNPWYRLFTGLFITGWAMASIWEASLWGHFGRPVFIAFWSVMGALSVALSVEQYKQLKAIINPDPVGRPGHDD